ncbi:MAG: beta-ketoacyl-[acyl-carrier-protein] synthase II, partial [Caldilineaceae bacterium]|nr:beta-ketoacyl-[acyl-carrier-protein] synthase II [Caldilineaceae bacterium]
MSRVFITGLGAITPIGNDAHTYWQNLVAGKSGAGHITSYDTADMPYTIACEVKGFDAAGMM